MPNVRLSDEKPTLDWVLGFDSIRSIRPAEQMEIISFPCREFKPNRLIIPKMISECFLIDDFNIDGKRQWQSGVSIHAIAFAPQYFSLLLDLDVAPRDLPIRLIVTNCCAGGLRFTASLHGPRAKSL